MALLQTLKSLVNQRLSAVAEEIFGILGRILTEYEDEAFQIKQETDRQRRLLDMVLQPIGKLHREDSIHLLVCKDEIFPEQQQERTSSRVQEEPGSPNIKEEQAEIIFTLVKEEPESLQINEEQEELLQISEEDGGSTETLLSVKHEHDENIQTEPVASTSSQHMETQAEVVDCGTSQPTSDQLLSSHYSESDITEDSDEWDAMNDQSGLNKLKSHNTQYMGGNSLCLSNKLLHDLKSPKQSHSTRSRIGTKRLSCADCGKMFNRKACLERHTMIHTGGKPFTCTVCGKGCSQQGDLKRHMMTHTGEKPFTCTVCGTGFSRKDHLKLHMINHTREKPFTCTVCGKGCSHHRALKLHMRTHTGEKPFTCTFCGKGFSHNGDLKVHMRTHTGERPLKCKVCEKGFSQHGSLKKHMKTHNEETYVK